MHDDINLIALFSDFQLSLLASHRLQEIDKHFLVCDLCSRALTALSCTTMV